MCAKVVINAFVDLLFEVDVDIFALIVSVTTFESIVAVACAMDDLPGVAIGCAPSAGTEVNASRFATVTTGWKLTLLSNKYSHTARTYVHRPSCLRTMCSQSSCRHHPRTSRAKHLQERNIPLQQIPVERFCSIEHALHASHAGHVPARDVTIKQRRA